MGSTTITDFLARLADESGHAALSEAKLRRVGDPRAIVVIEEDGAVMAVGVAAMHRQADGSDHCEIETAVAHAMRFPEFERAVVEASLPLCRGTSVSVWSDRSTLDAALGGMGFSRVRRLLYMVLEGGVEANGVTRGLQAGEEDTLVSINNLAFAGHREAASMGIEDIRRLEREPWFDRQGIRVVEVGGSMAGFCWTKVHPNGDGEIYRIAVAPEHQGTGLGALLVTEGYAHLLAKSEVRRGSLWVDEANERAIHLYERMGMVVERSNSEFERVS